MPLKEPVRPQESKTSTFMTLRQTFASHLVMAGVDLVTVKELLGHKHINMTLGYSHLIPEHKAPAVARLGERFKADELKSQNEVVAPELKKRSTRFDAEVGTNRNSFLVRKGRGLGLLNDNAS
jgi:hypothetical protein